MGFIERLPGLGLWCDRLVLGLVIRLITIRLIDEIAINLDPVQSQKPGFEADVDLTLSFAFLIGKRFSIQIAETETCQHLVSQGGAVRRQASLIVDLWHEPLDNLFGGLTDDTAVEADLLDIIGRSVQGGYVDCEESISSLGL